MASASGVTLNVTTGSGIALEATYTRIISINLTENSASSTGWYADVTANMYVSKTLYTEGAEPLDAFRWRYEHDPSVRESVSVLALANLQLKESVSGVSLPGVTGSVNKSRGYDFTESVAVE